jgi:hypothetical protein
MDSSDFMVNIINNYVKFYREEIKPIGLFDGINETDIGSTNMQLNLLYAEMKTYETMTNDAKKVINTSKTQPNLKFTIYKNDKPYQTSHSLFSLLIEISNLELEEPGSVFKIKKNIL